MLKLGEDSEVRVERYQRLKLMMIAKENEKKDCEAKKELLSNLFLDFVS